MVHGEKIISVNNPNLNSVGNLKEKAKMFVDVAYRFPWLPPQIWEEITTQIRFSLALDGSNRIVYQNHIEIESSEVSSRAKRPKQIH